MQNRAWIHFIGRSYYSKQAFIKEARHYGVSRRVNRKVLEKMRFGDMVYLVQHKKDVGALVIGRFRITSLSGLSADAMLQIHERATLHEVPGPLVPTMVSRGCGSYTIAATYHVTEDIPELLAYCADVEDIGVPLIGGTFEAMPRCILKDIPFRMGFRDFDAEAFMNALADRLAITNPVIRGQFYDFSQTPTPPDAHEGAYLEGFSEDEQRFLLAIQGYTKK